MVCYRDILRAAVWLMIFAFAVTNARAVDPRLKDSIYGDDPFQSCHRALSGFANRVDPKVIRKQTIDSIYREFFDPQFIDGLDALPYSIIFQTDLFQKILDHLTLYFPEGSSMSAQLREKFLEVFKVSARIDSVGFDARFAEAIRHIDKILREQSAKKPIESRDIKRLDDFTRENNPLSIRDLKAEIEYEFTFDRQPELGTQVAVFSTEVVQFIKTHKFGARWLSIMMKGLVGPFGEQGIKAFDKGIYMHLLGWTHEVKHLSAGHERLVVKNEGSRWYAGKLHH